MILWRQFAGRTKNFVGVGPAAPGMVEVSMGFGGRQPMTLCVVLSVEEARELRAALEVYALRSEEEAQNYSITGYGAFPARDRGPAEMKAPPTEPKETDS